jgi:hypothetical protein
VIDRLCDGEGGIIKSSAGYLGGPGPCIAANAVS